MPEFDRSAERDERVTAPEQSLAPAAPPLAVQRVLGLQRSAGNAAVASMLARQPAPHSPATEPTTEEEAIEQAEDFFRSGPYTGTLTPGEGIYHGGFDATYDPTHGRLTVGMMVGVDFKHGITDGTPLTAADASLNAAATHADTLAGPDRAAFIAQYQWQDAERGTWRTQLESTIEGTWSRAHEFHLNKPGFEWLGAQVEIDLDVHDAVSSGSDHLTVTALKTPPGTNLYRPVPGSPAAGTDSRTFQGDPANAHDQSMVVASTDLGPRPDVDFLNHSVNFGLDDSTLTPAATAELDRFITTFNGAPGNAASVQMPVTLVGHASQSGGDRHNQDLSDARVAAVRQYFVDHGFGNVTTRVGGRGEGERGANPVEDAADRRVDVIAGNGARQSLIAHEFGHAFGLGDEYVVTGNAGYVGSGTAPGVAGNPVSHHGAASAMQDASGAPMPGAVGENTDSIMSLGTAIRPQHYSTFHRALTEITAQSPWALGPPQPHPRRRTPAP